MTSDKMKVLVTEMPYDPSECVFAEYDSYYQVAECKLSDNRSYECTDVEKCPYLKALKEWIER